MQIAAIIPARGGSRRLKNKNIFPLNGKPLLSYSIMACKKSKRIDRIFVSSDDDKILSVAKREGAIGLLREKKYAADDTPKITAVRQAVLHSQFISEGPFEILVILQANSPEITAGMIDKGISFLLENNLWEVMSTDKHGVQNAAFRIIRTEHLNNDFLSAHCGFVTADCTDVHTEEDIRLIEKKWLGI